MTQSLGRTRQQSEGTVEPEGRRPVTVWLVAGLLTFLGLTALGGGGEMLLFPEGNQFVPGEWLDHIPVIESWVLPGLVLGTVFGFGSLTAAWGVIRRPRWSGMRCVESATAHHWSWAAALLLGAGLVIWILLEVILLPERNIIELLYGSVGVALVGLPLVPSVSSYMASRG